MYKRFFLTLIFLILVFTIKAQPQITWQKCFGSSSNDQFLDAIKTKDDNNFLISVFYGTNDVF
jgi:hypothetical protein